MENDENNIIIIGGGFGGLRVALDLARAKVFKKGYRVIVLDKTDQHIYNPLLYEIAAGCVDLEISAKKIAKGVISRLFDYAREHGFEFYKGEAVLADAKTKKIFLKDGSSIDFAALVFAAGAETNFFGIPGLSERALTLKNLEDALRIRKKIMDLLENKRRGEGAQIKVIIGGGGATGVELAAEMSGNFHHLEREGKLGPEDWSITLVEASSRILSMLGENISERARERLEALGVKVLRDTCIKRVEDGRVILAPRPLHEGEKSEDLLCDFSAETERFFSCDILIWAGGICANPLLQKSGLEVDRKGRVAISETMEVLGKERENIYAIGDCAVLINPQTREEVPAMAQAAIVEAKVAALNILDDLEGFKARVFYKFRNYPVVAPLGGKFAIAVVGRFCFVGFAGWLIRQLADLRYFLSVLPFWKAVKLWFYGARVYTHND